MWNDDQSVLAVELNISDSDSGSVKDCIIFDYMTKTMKN